MARTYFPLTTPSQRRLLFETWQATGDIAHACQVAHVGRRTFYYWKPRFLAEGYAGLEHFGSHVPHHPHQTAPDVVAQVIALKEEQPDWGKQRLADELAKAQNWVPLVSPNTVKRILRDAGLWSAPAVPGEKRGPTGENRTADEPGQTLNIDLCFVPATHETAQRLPAVSGSSGRLVVYGPRPRAEEAERTWPGQVFQDPETAYDAAMQEFVQRSAPRTPRRKAVHAARQQHDAAAPTAPCSRRQQERQRAAQWAQLLQKRQQEDAAWAVACREREASLRPDQWSPRQYAIYLAAEDRWALRRAQRQATLARRQQEDAQWQEDLQQQAVLAPQPAKPPWIAILVVTDNCTRQCLELPLFAAGAKVTAEEVIAALRFLLPEQLQFLISDRGTHFTAQQFAQFAQEEDFIHVLIARHRPQSNGIAERFVRTLKEWLADRAWCGTEALERLLAAFRAAYNDRPHQGLALPGLSPNEFAARFWLL